MADFPTTGCLDNFNRANEDPATGWTDIGTPGVAVVSNTLGQTGAGGNAYFNTPCSTADQEVFCQIATKPSTDNEIIMNARRNPGGGGADEGYMVWFITRTGTDEIQLRDPVDNVLFTGNKELSAGDWFGMRIVGTTISAWYHTDATGWVKIGEATDSDNDGTGSKNKLSIYLGDDVNTKIDNFSGGDYAPWTPGSDSAAKQFAAVGSGRW